MKKLNIVQPHSIERKMFVDIILSSDIVKAHKIDPSTALLLSRSEGIGNIQLKINREDLVKNEIENKIPAEKVSGSLSRHHCSL